MNKISPINNVWFDWLLNYLSKSIRRSVGLFKDKIER